MRKLVFVIFVLLSFSCKKDHAIMVSSIKIRTLFNTIRVGQSSVINCFVYPIDADDKTISWNSSNTQIATIDNGVITGHRNGIATITVTANDGSEVSAQYDIRVIETLSEEWIISKWNVTNKNGNTDEQYGHYHVAFFEFKSDGSYFVRDNYSTLGPETDDYYFGAFNVLPGNTVELSDLGIINVYEYTDSSIVFYFTRENMETRTFSVEREIESSI